MMMPMQNDALMTATEAGAVLGKSSSTVRRLAESGDLRYAQKLAAPNGAYLFRTSDVRQYLADHAGQAEAVSG